MSKDGNFKLIPTAPATAEKSLVDCAKKIRTYENGIRNAGAQMFGYAYLQGRELLRAKSLLPHGAFLPWIQQTFPEISERTARYRMTFAETINSRLLEDKSATVADLKPSFLNGNKLTRKDQEAVLQLVPQVMDGRGIMEFMRGARFIPEKQKPEYHPPAELTPEEIATAETQQAENLVTQLISDISLMIESETLTRVSPQSRQRLLDAGIELNNKLRELIETAKKKGAR